MKAFSPKIFDGLAVLSIVATVLAIWLGLVGSESVKTNEAHNASVRVEVQRYMGYEILPVRYLSLPYDLTMGANEQIQMLDMGLLLLIFVPVVMLLGFRTKPGMQLAVILSCLFLLVISAANGILVGVDGRANVVNAQSVAQYLEETSFSEAPVGVIVAGFYQVFTAIYSVIYAGISKISGEQDAITYPILVLAFGLFYQVARQRMEEQEEWLKGLSAFLFTYLFFWLILSSGIVWYGLLAFPLLTLLIFRAISFESGKKDALAKISLYGFYFVVAAWLAMGFANRISNVAISVVQKDKIAGKRLYDPAFIKYQVGDYSERKVVDAFYTNLSTAFDLINVETKSLIYNVGTRFAFFIKENDKRVFKDNQLDLFNQLYSKYADTKQIIPLLKASGFKYILVDLYITSVDNTPERILSSRFKAFMNYLINDPSVELIATNRKVKVETQQGISTQYGLAGEMQASGSYAVFRIN